MNKDFEVENEKMYTIREAADICVLLYRCMISLTY